MIMRNFSFCFATMILSLFNNNAFILRDIFIFLSWKFIKAMTSFAQQRIAKLSAADMLHCFCRRERIIDNTLHPQCHVSNTNWLLSLKSDV